MAKVKLKMKKKEKENLFKNVFFFELVFFL